MSLENLEDDEVLALHFSEAALGPELAAWCEGSFVRGVVAVPVVSGPSTAGVGDWIVRDAAGCFHVLSPEDFALRYASAGE